MLLAVVVGVGGALVGVASSIASSVARVEPPPRVAVYLVYNKTVVVSWDDRVIRADFVCPGVGVVDRAEIARGVYVSGLSCEGLIVVASGYVIKPTRVL